jgi:hypothetical protein
MNILADTLLGSISDADHDIRHYRHYEEAAGVGSEYQIIGISTASRLLDSLTLFYQLHEITRIPLAKARCSGLLYSYASMSLTPSR